MSSQPEEIDLTVLWRGVRRRLWAILATTVTLGILSFFISQTRPTVYEAQATLYSVNNQGTDSALSSAIVKAPPLPDGALAQALDSTSVIEPLINAVRQAKEIPLAERLRLQESLSKELRQQNLQTIVLNTRLDFSGNGIYTIRARARTARAAQITANLAVQTLIKWDRNRALENLRRAQAGYVAQLAQVDQLLSNTFQSIERQTLITRRANIQGNLSQVRLLQDSISGVLNILSFAVEPLRPIAPKPLRDAIITSIFGLILAITLAAILTTLDRTVRTEEDFQTIGLPSLAVIPRLRQRDVLLNGVIRAARQAGLYEAIGFLRVNLLSSLAGRTHPVIMVTSTAPGEGKSSLTATLADGFASSGKRILIIDADLRRGTQDAVWKKYNEGGVWIQLVGEGGMRTTREALLNPKAVQVLQVEDRIDLLPAGPGVHDSLAILNQADINHALALWRTKYDIILIDSAPLLALADGLILGSYSDAVIMVTEYGKTNLQAIRSALRRAERANLNIIGFVINKANSREEFGYGYSYSYTPRAKESV